MIMWRKMERFSSVATLKRYELNKAAAELLLLSQQVEVLLYSVDGALAETDIAFGHFGEQVARFA